MSSQPEWAVPADLAGRLSQVQSVVLTEPARARQELLAVLAQLRELPAGAGQKGPHETLALLELARCALLLGDYPEMRARAMEALPLAHAAQLPSLETRALNSLGLAHQRRGELDQAMRFFLDSLRLARHHLLPEAEARALGNIGLVYLSLGEPQRALELHERALEVAQASGHAAYVSNLLASVMEDHAQLGSYARVLDLADEALAYARERGLARSEANMRVTLARTLLSLGRACAALRMARQGLRVATWAGDQEMIATLRGQEGEALHALGDPSGAQLALGMGLHLSQATGHRQEEQRLHEALARVFTAQGQMELAARHTTQAAALRQALSGPDVTTRTREVVQEFAGLGEAVTHPWSAELAELTQSLREANTELARRAAHDPLTGVLNRLSLQARLERLLALQYPDDLLGVVFLNVDHMKAMNELYGQSQGDLLMVDIARRLKESLRAGDLVGRLGSDEFVLVLTSLARAEDLGPVMERLLGELRRGFSLGAQVVPVTASLGGVVSPQGGTTLEELFARADRAMEQVKASGRNGARVYEPELGQESERQRALTYDLRRAGERGQWRLHYQPVFGLEGSALLGFEALLRWEHPRFGLLMPGQFIPLAEESRVILTLGHWVLREACAQARAWDLAGLGLSVAVNVSALQFAQPDFVQGVRAALREQELPGGVLVLELTETMLHEDHSLAASHLAALRELGVGVALDDFGTGYSSLSLLRTLNFDLLKIDQTFLQGLSPDDPTYARSRLLLSSLVELGRKLGMSLVAEGVETELQAQILRDLGCEQAQGYYLARPAPPETFGDLLEACRSRLEQLQAEPHGAGAEPKRG